MVFDGAWPIDQFQFTYGSDQANQQAVQIMQQFVQYAKYCQYHCSNIVNSTWQY